MLDTSLAACVFVIMRYTKDALAQTVVRSTAPVAPCGHCSSLHTDRLPTYPRCRSPPAPFDFAISKNRMEDNHMQNWQKDRNYRKHENTDGSFTYIVTIDGVDVEVSEAVYKAYSQADRRERYLDERDAGVLLSLDRMDEDGVPSFLSDRHVPSAENTALREMLIGQAVDALMSLEPDERALIDALIIDGITERDYAAQIGLSQQAVNKRRKKILEKLRNLVVKT